MEAEAKQSRNNGFLVITYTGARHIHYLEDHLAQNPGTDFQALDLEAMDPNGPQGSDYDSIYEKLYKKFARDGYLQKTREVTKKSKRGGDENFYNGADPFIDDAQTLEERDPRETTFWDFKSVSVGLHEFYRSPDYTPEVAAEARRKPDRIEITQEERERIIRKVKNRQREEQQARELKRQMQAGQDQ